MVYELIKTEKDFYYFLVNNPDRVMLGFNGNGSVDNDSNLYKCTQEMKRHFESYNNYLSIEKNSNSKDTEIDKLKEENKRLKQCVKYYSKR